VTTHIILTGEQPLPNLLPLRHYRPEAVLAVYSSRTENAWRRLAEVAGGGVRFYPLFIRDPYDIFAVQEALQQEIARLALPPAELVVNFTGGTKPMSLAAYFAAAVLGAPMIYIQSEGKQTRCYEYAFTGGRAALTGSFIIPGVITIDDYLKAHTGQGVRPRKMEANDYGHRFEMAIYEALQPPAVDETARAVSLDATVDIDLVVRCGNQAAVIEAKTGLKGVKNAIDQLDTATEQRYLGTYTGKILVTDQDLAGRSNLTALAKKQRITVIQLTGFAQSGALSRDETLLLQREVQKVLGKAV